MSQAIAPIYCDGCGKDITARVNCEDYRLVLKSESKTPWYHLEGKDSGLVTAMAIEPQIDGERHFCDLECLSLWCHKGFGNARPIPTAGEPQGK